MLRRLCLIIIIVLLVGAGLFPIQAQDETVSTCNFAPNPSASVFDDLAKVTDMGIKAEDVNALAVAARDPSVNPGEFLISKGYDEAQVNDIMSNPDNVARINQLVNPSPARDLLDRAYALLGSYGLSSGALLEIYKLTSDPQALSDYLVARGLSPEQATAFTESAGGLAAEAQSLGVFQYAATLDGQDVLDKNGYTNLPLNAISNDLDDPDALRAKLLKEGVSDADVDSMVADFQTLHDEHGLTENYLDAWQTKTLGYSLDYYGIPSDKLLPLAAQGNDESIRDCLSAAGFDPSAIDIATSEFGKYVEGEDGEEALLSTKDIIEAGLDDAGLLAAEWDLSGAELAELNSLSDDPDALREKLMQDYGMSDEDADLFAGELGSSNFAAVFDNMTDADAAMIDDAKEAAENGEAYTLGDDFDVDSFVDNMEENATDGENIGEEGDTDENASGDEASNDDTSGDDASSDDNGGEDVSNDNTDTGENASGDEATDGDNSSENASGDTGSDTSGGDSSGG